MENPVHPLSRHIIALMSPRFEIHRDSLGGLPRVSSQNRNWMPIRLCRGSAWLVSMMLPFPVFADTKVAVSNHTVVVRSNGSLVGSGSNFYSQLGLGDQFSRTTFCPPAEPGPWNAVWAGPTVTFARKTDGSLWASGGPNYDLLGTGVPVLGKTFARIGTATDWVHVSAGNSHAIGCRDGGTLWSWGSDTSGSLGLGSPIGTQYVPVQIGNESGWSAVDAGYYHNLAVKSDGSLWAWGSNTNGQLGIGNTSSRSVPTRIGTLTGWRTVSAGQYHSLSIRDDGTLWAWGRNQAGQLGTGNTTTQNTPVQIGVETGWAAVSAGADHSLAIRSDGSLWAWGNNGSGRLGLNDTTNRLSPTRVGIGSDWATVEAGASHSAAVKTNGEVWVWGGNQTGQLGTASANQLSPVLPSFGAVSDLAVSNVTNPSVDSQVLTSIQSLHPFPTTIVGAPTSREFTLLNLGAAPLEITAMTTDPGFGFDLSLPSTLAPGASLVFSVILDATVSGTLDRGMMIVSNDPDEPEFAINHLYGTVHSFQSDGDGDGLSDAAEFKLSAFGFRVGTPDSQLIGVMHREAHRAGLVSGRGPGTIVASRDAGTGMAKLQVKLQKAATLPYFVDTDITGASVDGTGRLLVPHPRSPTSEFFRFTVEPKSSQP
jgi:alpha-tubulin suppressor-like RCC1 family protein